MSAADIHGRLWREIVVPPHEGGGDLIAKIRASGMTIDTWTEGLVHARALAPRRDPLVRRLARVTNEELGFETPLVSIAETKQAGRSLGLQFLSIEDILALRLSYAEQPTEWVRIAMETYIDADGSYLDIALVNDGTRRDLRTTWAFPQNLFQISHAWLWRCAD